MEQLRSIKDALLRLGPVRLGTMAAAAVAVLLLVGWVATRQSEPYGLLYAGLDPAEAGRIAAKLEELKVPMKAGPDGGSISVPASQVARLRMDLAASGLPRQGGAGYELLDAQSPMNMTSFMQRVARLRALEGELARTIISMDDVRTARVHIVMPDRETFSREAPAPSASITVSTKTGSRLTTGQASAIRLLVAGAVPKLRQEDVSVLDGSGVVLAAEGQAGAASAVSSRLSEAKAAQEQGLQRAILDLLEPLVGRGKVRAVASVEIDSAREVSREERYDPLAQVERSRQIQRDVEQSEETRPRDPVTVGQNLPNQQVGAGANGGRSTSSANRTGETINYEISNTISERTREPGTLKRLAVAVAIDWANDAQGNLTPRPQEELDRLSGLVRAAVGYDERRGDRVTVETLRFGVRPAAEGTTTSTDATASGTNMGLVIGGTAAVVLLALLGTLLLLRSRRQREAAAAALAAAQAAEAAPQEEMVTIADIDGAIRASSIAALNDLIDKRPDETLAVLRAWIAEESVS